jgi:hypothetical protein
LKEEGLSEKIKMKELMDMYKNTLDLVIFTSRRALPLHKQLKNLYRKNKKLKVEATIEREELVEKRGTPAVKKTTPTKEKHVVVI